MNLLPLLLLKDTSSGLHHMERASVSEFVVRMNKLASTCSFAESKALRDRLVSGLHSCICVVN